MFFVLLILYYAGIGLALSASFFFFVLLTVGCTVPCLRQQRLLPLLAAAGVIASGLFLYAFKTAYEPALALDGITVKAVVKMTDSVQYRSGRYICSGETESIDDIPQTVKVRLSFNERPDVGAYDYVEGVFYLSAFKSSGDAAVSLDSVTHASITAYPGGYSDRGLVFHTVPAKDKSLVFRFIQLRDLLNQSLKNTISGQRGELASALLFGKSDSFPAGLKSRFNAVGVSHTVCVSGLHLSIWIFGAYRLLRLLQVKRRMAASATVFFTLCYMALTGFPYSVVRAGIMMITVMAGKLFRRRGDGLNSLGLAAALILFQDPFSAGDLSFSLSFSATLGILLFSKSIHSQWILPVENKMRKPWGTVFGYGADIVAVTACATVFSLPLMLLNFGKINFISFIGNLLLLPVVPTCMVTAGFTAVCSLVPFADFLTMTFGAACDLLCRYMILVVNGLSRIHVLTVYPSVSAILIWLGFLAAGLVICHYLSGKYPIAKRVTASVLIVAFAGINIAAAVEERYTADVRVIGVGDASAVLLKKGSRAVLIGCGRDGKDSLYAITDALEEEHVGDLMLMVVPCTDSPVSGNAAQILQRFHVEQVACRQGAISYQTALPDSQTVILQGSARRSLWRDCTLTVTAEQGNSFALAECFGIKVLIALESDGTMCDFDTTADFLITRASVPPTFTSSVYRAVIVSGSKDAAKTGYHSENIMTADGGDIVLKLHPGGKYKLINHS